MLRSLLAIIVAVVLGLTTAKFVEGAFAAALGLGGEAHDISRVMGDGYLWSLLASWIAGAAAATTAALLIGKRWAPLGYLAGAAMALQGALTLLGADVPIWSWALALGAPALVCFAIVKALGATLAPRTNQAPDDFFRG